MNILIIHQHFKTPEEGGAIRSYFLAKALVQRGTRVQVLTGSNNPESYQKNIEGIDVHYLPVAYANRFGFWLRIFSFLKFVMGCLRASAQFKQVDLCYAISVPLPVGIPARWMKWRYGIPYIFEVGDLWPDAAIELDVIRNPLLKKFLWRMERKIYQRASAIVALSPAIREAILKKAPGKIVHNIPNMADCDFFKKEEKQTVLVDKFGVKGKLVVSYFGAMGFANGLEYLLACAQVCERENLPVQFMFAGEGAEKDNIIKKAQTLKLANVVFHAFQNREGIEELMNITDAVFVCYRHAAILETGSPNKFFDGLAAGKLIIINFGGWIKKEIEEARCGFSVHPERPEEIIAQLKPFLIGSELAHYQTRARQLAEQKFSLDELTAQWVEILRAEKTSSALTET